RRAPAAGPAADPVRRGGRRRLLPLRGPLPRWRALAPASAAQGRRLTDPDDIAARPLRSFGRIRGRPIKPRQASLMESLLPALALPEGPIEPAALAPEAREVWLEIGFGGGEHLAAQAGAHRDVLL